MKTKEYHLHSIIMKISLCSLEICHNARQDESVLGSYLVRLRTCQTELRQLRTDNLDFSQAILEHEFEVALLSMALRCRIAVTKRAGLPQYDGHIPRPGENPTEEECNAIVELAYQIIQMYIYDKSASPTFPRLLGAYTACSFLLSGEVADTATTAEIRNIHKTLHAALTILPDSPGSNVAAIPSTKTPEPCRDSRAASIDQRNESPHSSSIGENAYNDVSNLQPAVPDPVSASQNYWVVSTASGQGSRPDPVPRGCPPHSIDQRNETSHSSISENASNVSDLLPAASHPVCPSQNYWVVSTASEHVSRPDPVPRGCLPAPMDQRIENPHSSISENASNASNLQPAASDPVSTSQNYWVVGTASEHVSRPEPVPSGCTPAPLLPYGMQAPPSVDQPHIEYAWPINLDAVGAQLSNPEAGQRWMSYVWDAVYGSGHGPQGDVNATQALGYQQWLYSC
ncbi:hypothetical protein LTR67_004976 [Exophiala xenobiotica]